MEQQLKKKRVQSKAKTPDAKFYLGTKEKKEARLKSLEEQAAKFGAASIAEYIQMIADNDLIVILPESND